MRSMCRARFFHHFEFELMNAFDEDKRVVEVRLSLNEEVGEGTSEDAHNRLKRTEDW